MASIKPYRDTWRAQIFVLGVRDSKCFRTKREAESWASARETSIRNQSNRPAGEKHGEEVSPKKRGKRWEQIRIEALIDMPSFPASLPIGELTTTHFADWRDSRLKQVTPGTVLRELTVISSVFETARKEWRWVSENPLRDLKKPRQPDHREVTIDLWKIRRMLVELGWNKGPCKSTKQAAGRAFMLALRSGMRAGEICALTAQNVRDDYCILPVTKTKPRSVPLIPSAKRIIDSMAGWDDKTVFGITAQTLDATFRKARKSSGLDGFTFHDSRHTAATILSRKVDVLTLCKIFGWANTSQALTYYNPTASDIARQLSAKSGPNRPAR